MKGDSVSMHAMSWLMLGFILAAYLVAAIHFPVAYIWMSYEDLYGEWAQTFLFAIAMLCCMRLSFVPGRSRGFFVLLSMALFYVVMEEISWGQRILGFDTPAFFLRHNLQQEANLHNLLVGPFNTSTKGAVELLMAAALFGYGVLYPVMLRGNVWPASLLSRAGMVPPPSYLAPFFAIAAVLELGLFQFNEAEVAELLVAYALAVMSVHYWMVSRAGRRERSDGGYGGKPVPSLLAMPVLLLAVIALSLFTTERLYADQVNRARIDNRVYNGYEKFARRYERHGAWAKASLLYEKVLETTPSRTGILRALADCQREMGREDLFRYYNQQALNLGLKRYAGDPRRVSFNLSLARTYRQRGDEMRAEQHLSRAKKLAEQHVRLEPRSARAAYWMAETFRELGDERNARESYGRAYELQPESARYRKAYFGYQEGEADDEDA